MSNLKTKNLNHFITGTSTAWQAQANTYHANKKHIKRAQLFALELLDYMEAHHISQKELAERMGVSPQQVNKILRAKSNLTFDTLDKIEAALGVSISNPKIEALAPIHAKTVSKSMQVVYKNIQGIVKVNKTSKPVNINNPILQTSIKSMDVYKYTAGQI